MNASLTGMPPTPLETFQEQCEARAHLYADGELPLAHDTLQEAAKCHGLIDQYGQDEIQSTMAEAFRSVRAGEEPS
jgi:hypothetical protein